MVGTIEGTDVMSRRTRYLVGTLLATSFVTLQAGTARAQPVQGLYVGAAGGANLLQDEEVRLSPSFPGGKTRWDVGIAGLGSVGYGFGNGVRVEIEGNYRQNTLQHFLQTRFPTLAGGDQNSYGAMANVLFDMDVGQNWIYPYLGVGVGYAWSHWQLHDVGTNYPFAENLAGTSQGNFAYQAMLGVGVPVPWVVGLSLTAEYRFYSIVAPQGFTGSSIGEEAAFGAGPYATRRGNLDINSNYNHSLLLGLRYEFNPAPPPPPGAVAPPAAPAPTPARTYLVFFDWDRDVLTPRARQIVAEAASASTHIQTTTIAVDGYADTSHGLPGARGEAYNQHLSQRRAEAVRGELIRDGVPANVISIHGYGDTHLLVATGPNTREPQNRRVEIVLH